VLISARDTDGYFYFVIFQNRPGDTSWGGWLFQVQHVRRELYGSSVKRDQRGESELANEGLLARLGVQFY